jgi:hypothetical protein
MCVLRCAGLASVRKPCVDGINCRLCPLQDFCHVSQAVCLVTELNDMGWDEKKVSGIKYRVWSTYLVLSKVFKKPTQRLAQCTKAACGPCGCCATSLLSSHGTTIHGKVRRIGAVRHGEAMNDPGSRASHKLWAVRTTYVLFECASGRSLSVALLSQKKIKSWSGTT